MEQKVEAAAEALSASFTSTTQRMALLERSTSDALRVAEEGVVDFALAARTSGSEIEFGVTRSLGSLLQSVKALETFGASAEEVRKVATSFMETSKGVESFSDQLEKLALGSPEQFTRAVSVMRTMLGEAMPKEMSDAFVRAVESATPSVVAMLAKELGRGDISAAVLRQFELATPSARAVLVRHMLEVPVAQVVAPLPPLPGPVSAVAEGAQVGAAAGPHGMLVGAAAGALSYLGSHLLSVITEPFRILGDVLSPLKFIRMAMEPVVTVLENLTQMLAAPFQEALLQIYEALTPLIPPLVKLSHILANVLANLGVRLAESLVWMMERLGEFYTWLREESLFAKVFQWIEEKIKPPKFEEEGVGVRLPWKEGLIYMQGPRGLELVPGSAAYPVPIPPPTLPPATRGPTPPTLSEEAKAILGTPYEMARATARVAGQREPTPMEYVEGVSQISSVSPQQLEALDRIAVEVRRLYEFHRDESTLNPNNIVGVDTWLSKVASLRGT
jgi:hypothetical protein